MIPTLIIKPIGEFRPFSARETPAVRRIELSVHPLYRSRRSKLQPVSARDGDSVGVQFAVDRQRDPLVGGYVLERV